MITVPGTITIRSIDGRFGSFNVGTLDCSLGSFTVKDSSIEEFNEGGYSGNFVIDKIKPHSYMTGGRLVVEIRATLSAIMLNKNEAPLPAAHYESMEQDPIEEEHISQPESPISAPQDVPPVRDERSESPVDEVAALFGVIWPLGNIVKLDPTINRAVFRQQKDYLKSVGYTFEAANQHWLKQE